MGCGCTIKYSTYSWYLVTAIKYPTLHQFCGSSILGQSGCRSSFESGSRVLMTKNCQNLQLKKKNFLYQKSKFIWTSKLQEKPSATSKYQVSSLFFYLCEPCLLSWIRIRLSNADPDPADYNQCGSGNTLPYTTLLYYIPRCCPFALAGMAGPERHSRFSRQKSDTSLPYALILNSCKVIICIAKSFWKCCRFFSPWVSQIFWEAILLKLKPLNFVSLNVSTTFI